MESCTFSEVFIQSKFVPYLHDAGTGRPFKFVGLAFGIRIVVPGGQWAGAFVIECQHQKGESTPIRSLIFLVSHRAASYL